MAFIYNNFMEAHAFTQKMAELPLFKGFSETDLDGVIRLANHRRVDAGEFVFMQDDPADTLYVLEQGRLKLTQIGPDGQQILLQMIGAWTLFAVVAILEGANYPITAQAAEPCRLIYWPKSILADMVQRYPRLSINAMQLMAARMREYQDRFRELATERVERRLARALIRLASQTGKKTDEGVLIDMPLTRQDLAEMTGTTLFTASRILSQWETQGLVKSSRERVIIVFPHGLVQIADDLPPRTGEDPSNRL